MDRRFPTAAVRPPPMDHHWTTVRRASQIKESDSDVEVPESFFTAKELETLMEETKPEWVPASSYFTAEDEEGSAGKVGRGGLFVEEPATGARLRRLSNGEMRYTALFSHSLSRSLCVFVFLSCFTLSRSVCVCRCMFS